MGQCGEMEICKDRLLHLHRIKQKFTSVGSRSGAFMTASSSGARAALSLFFLGLSLNVSRVEGSWDFFPPSESGEAAGRSAWVCLFGKAFQLIVYSGSTAGPRWPHQALQMLPAGAP